MKVLLIDDHALFREGLALLLKPLVPDLAVMEAGAVEEGLALLKREGGADLVLIDLAMPGKSGLEGIALIRAQHEGTPVVALSSSDDKATVLRALAAGAMGFIPKSYTSGVFGAALRLILAKGIYLPPTVFLADREPVPAPESPACRPRDLGLTERQTQVLHLILQGHPAKLIGRKLDLSPGTVKAHTTAVLRALNVTSRTQAVVAAGRLGLRFD